MAFVYSKATFAGIVTSLGNSDAYLQAAQTGTATSGLAQLQTARGDVADRRYKYFSRIIKNCRRKRTKYSFICLQWRSYCIRYLYNNCNWFYY